MEECIFTKVATSSPAASLKMIFEKCEASAIGVSTQIVLLVIYCTKNEFFY